MESGLIQWLAIAHNATPTNKRSEKPVTTKRSWRITGHGEKQTAIKLTLTTAKTTGKAKMNQNLVICPTLDRPDQLAKMVDSFYKTQTISDLIILTAIGSITGIINFVNYSNYRYVTITNDDFVFKTFGWDEIFIKSMRKPGFAYGFDGVNHKLPSTCMIDTRVCRALGWIQLPTLEHLCGDLVWQYLGEATNRLYYCPSVKIEHNHFIYSKSEKDAVYERTNSAEMYRKDNESMRQWLRSQAEDDVRKIMAL